MKKGLVFNMFDVEKVKKMRYTVKIYSDGYMYSYESNSRDSLKHLYKNVGTVCKVYSKNGKLLSKSRYDKDIGFHRCVVESFYKN